MRDLEELQRALDALTEARDSLDATTAEGAYIAGSIHALRWVLGDSEDLDS